MLDETQPDLIILDAQLPQVDRLEVCRAARQRLGQAIGIIMMSGIKKETLDRVVGLEIGADVYLTKPFERLRVQVSDEGIGIAEADLPYLFDTA